MIVFKIFVAIVDIFHAEYWTSINYSKYVIWTLYFFSGFTLESKICTCYP